MCDDITLYIIGESRTNVDNAITHIYGSFYIALEVEATTGLIIDFGCSHTLDITENFLKKLFIGKKLDNIKEIESELDRRYHGSSLKALHVSLINANKKYLEAKKRL